MNLRPYMVLMAFLPFAFSFASGCFWGADGALVPTSTPSPTAMTTLTAMLVPTNTPSPIPTPAMTSTPSSTATPVPASTPLPTPTVPLAPTSTPTPTPSAPSTATPTSIPSPTPTPWFPLVSSSASLEIALAPCTVHFVAPYAWQYDEMVRWSPDGSRILFTTIADIYAVSEDGFTLRNINYADRDILSPSDPVSGLPETMTYFDISPDGSRIVYSTCAYFGAGHAGPYDEEDYEYEDEEEYGYELVVSNIDGTDRRRLTENKIFDNFPVWSPDGTRIAFVSNPGLPDGSWSPDRHKVGRLVIYTMESGEFRDIELSIGDSVAHYPPVWSPDGQSIAFVAYEGKNRRAAYTIGVDSTRLTRISDALNAPGWSPDGQRIALVAPVEMDDGLEAVLYTFAADGSDPVMLAAVGPVEGFTWRRDGVSWRGGVSWSPDGSEILIDNLATRVASDGSFVINMWPIDWTVKRYPRDLSPVAAAWSPDGSRLAIRSREQSRYRYPNMNTPSIPLIYTRDRDVEDLSVLVEHVLSPIGYAYVAANSAEEDVEVSIASCSNGFVVIEPEENPGLVRDCEKLVGFRDSLTRGYPMNWGSGTPIEQWTGVSIGPIDSQSSTHRVVGLHSSWSSRLEFSVPSGLDNLVYLRTLTLRGNLTGSIPPELGNLVNLRTLTLGGNFTGSIPPELGNLVNLRTLSLTLRGEFTASIPPELGNLANLRTLTLGGNFTGSIPPELGNLVNLEELILSETNFTGGIPAELSNLVNLRKLAIGRNGLRLPGSIPPELGNLVNLEELYLEFSDLTGSIPPELGNLANLRKLYLEYNDLTGSIPPELGNLANLEELYLRNNDLTGSIPPELGNLANLRKLYLGSNDLRSIPPELGNLKRLQILNITGLDLTEGVPPEVRNIQWLIIIGYDPE